MEKGAKRPAGAGADLDLGWNHLAGQHKGC